MTTEEIIAAAIAAIPPGYEKAPAGDKMGDNYLVWHIGTDGHCYRTHQELLKDYPHTYHPTGFVLERQWCVCRPIVLQTVDFNPLRHIT